MRIFVVASSRPSVDGLAKRRAIHAAGRLPRVQLYELCTTGFAERFPCASCRKFSWR